MDNDEIKAVLSVLNQLDYRLSLLPDLVKQLSALGEVLPPLLKSQAEELVRMQNQISEVQESEVHKLGEKLASLTAQVAAKQEKHDQLEASERNLQARLQEIRKKVENATEAFRLAKAS